MYLLMNYCESSNFLTLVQVILKLLNVIFIGVPIVLIVLISFDFIKCVIANSDDDVKKISKTTLKRMLFAMLVFFVPTIVGAFVNMLGDLGVDYMECITNATDEKISYYKSLEEAGKTNNNPSDVIDSTGNNNNTNNNTNSNSNTSSNNSSSNQSSGNSNSTVGSDTTKKEETTKTDDSKKEKKKKGIDFRLSNDSITIGHYSSTVNTYTIKITNNKTGKNISKSKFNFESSNPGVVSVDENGKVVALFGGDATIKVSQKDNPENSKTIKVKVVHSIYVRVRIKNTYTGVSRVTGKKVRVPAGTEGVLNGIGYLPPKPGRSYNGYQAGDTIKIKGDYVTVDAINCQTYAYYKEEIYSPETAEEFINSQSKINSSNTKYLFWTSHGAQMEYMFKWSGSNWKVYRMFYINTGDAGAVGSKGEAYATTGVHFNYIVGEVASYGGYAHVIWKRTPSGGGTNPWHKDGDKSRTPKSHGCTRFSYDDMEYLVSINGQIKGSRLIDY